MTSGVINQIRNSSNLITFFQQQGRVMRSGSRYVTLCPFHSEKTPSCYVMEKYFCCFGCGAKGDIFEYIKRRDGVDFRQALRFLADLYGFPLDSKGGEYKQSNRNLLLQLNQEVADTYQQRLRSESYAMKYLQSERGLPLKVIDQYKVGYCGSAEFSSNAAIGSQEKTELLKELGILGVSKYGKFYDFFRDRIIFPIRDLGGRVIAYGGRIIKTPVSVGKFVPPKYLNSRDSELFNKSSIFYGWFEAGKAIRAAKKVYLVEGYLDVLSLVAAGIENVVATCGTAVTASHVERLNHLSEVVLVFDGDAAGQKAALRTLVMFLGESVKVSVVILPEGEDPDSFVRQHGRDAFIDLPRFSLLRGIVTIKLTSYGYLEHVPPSALKRLIEEFAQILADKKIALRSLIWLLCDEFCREVHIFTGVQLDLIRDMLSAKVEGYGKEFLSRTTGKGLALGVDISLGARGSWQAGRSEKAGDKSTGEGKQLGLLQSPGSQSQGSSSKNGPRTSELSRRDMEFVSALLSLDYCDSEIVQIIEELQGNLGEFAEEFSSCLLASINLSNHSRDEEQDGELFSHDELSFRSAQWQEIKSETVRGMPDSAEIFSDLLAEGSASLDPQELGLSEELRSEEKLQGDSLDEELGESSEETESTGRTLPDKGVLSSKLVAKEYAIDLLREMYERHASVRVKQSVVAAIMVPEASTQGLSANLEEACVTDYADALNALKVLDQARRKEGR